MRAREEFGLTQDDIVRAIRAGTLHHREGSMDRKGILMLFAIIRFFLAALAVKPRVQVHPAGITVLRARLVSVLIRPYMVRSTASIRLFAWRNCRDGSMSGALGLSTIARRAALI